MKRIMSTLLIVSLLSLSFNVIAQESFSKELDRIDFVELEFDVAPNPATNYIKIKVSQDLDNLEIVDLTGKSIIVLSEVKSEAVVDISMLQSSVYILIATVDNVRKTKRLIIE